MILRPYQVERWKRCKFNYRKIVNIFEGNKKLIKLDKALYNKYGFHLGQTVIIHKSYIDENGKRFVLPDRIMDTWTLDDTWYCYVAGIKKKRLVIARYFRDSPNPRHFLLPSIGFLEKMS